MHQKQDYIKYEFASKDVKFKKAYKTIEKNGLKEQLHVQVNPWLFGNSLQYGSVVKMN